MDTIKHSIVLIDGYEFTLAYNKNIRFLSLSHSENLYPLLKENPRVVEAMTTVFIIVFAVYFAAASVILLCVYLGNKREKE